MAIEKFIPTTTEISAADEFKEWMEQNATDYFDSFTIDEVEGSSKKVNCKIDDENVIALGFFTGTGTIIPGISVWLKNGVNMSDAGAPAKKYVTSAYKTSKGLLIINNIKEFIAISKTNDDTMAFAFFRASNTNNGIPQGYVYIGEYEQSQTFRNITPLDHIETFNNIQYILATRAGKTVMTPICFDSGNYTENLFQMRFSEYQGVECQFDLDGTKYVTNGIFALKE
jgi:hypothetical protein